MVNTTNSKSVCKNCTSFCTFFFSGNQVLAGFHYFIVTISFESMTNKKTKLKYLKIQTVKQTKAKETR